METANIHETDGGSVTVALPKPLLDFIDHTRRLLIATRVKHGAETPIGHRCSNIVELLDTKAPLTMIAKQMAELERLLAAQ